MTAIMGKMLFAKFLVLLMIAINVATCQDQARPQPESEQQSQQHYQTPPRTVAPRVNRRQFSAATTPAADYKALLNTLTVRFNSLVTLEEEQRSRLELISQKIVQFESSNLAHLESLGSRQIEFLKRLEGLESIQRMTRHEVEELRNDFLGNSTTGGIESGKSDVLTETNGNSIQRRIRNLPELRPEGGRVLGANDSVKLDALSTLLLSTRKAIDSLQLSLEANVANLKDETNKLNRRISNLQRRQHQQFQQFSNQGIGYPQAPTAQSFPRQLVTSCAQGAPTSHGILRVQLSERSDPFYVRCDEEYMNGGWIIIQNRYTGELNFQRDWREYKAGFGNLASEFFIGLDKLHLLTTSAVQELIIVLEDFEGVQRYARYNLFAIGDESEFYELKLLGEYEGNAGDSFTYHAGHKFSTFDNDNDGCVECNCAQAHSGGWWYNWCDMSNLNGMYYKPNETVQQFRGVYWHNFHGPKESLRAVRMMIRPAVIDQENRR